VFAEALRERSAGIVELSSAQIEVLERHYNLMVRWNKALNLTKIVDPGEAAARHYLESLFLALHLPAGQLNVADVGSGPGFPGFPVAVLRPDCEVSLIESHQRKGVFLRETSRGMTNVRVIVKRAEEVTDRFDWMISRAVSYEDLTVPVRSLAPAAALLTGEEAPPPEWVWHWEAPLRVPGGKSRFLRLGWPEVSGNVSRETENQSFT
jgi:16S rRNA (guanine(527)-N(7))-methyltransferase RsmG